MSTRVLFAAFAAVTICTGCQRQPVAAFEADNKQAEVGQVISFQNKSKDAVSYSWDFGDGSKSAEPSPQKTYTKDGLFRVRLIAYSGNRKKSDVKEINILVDEKLNGRFAGNHRLSGQRSEEYCENGSVLDGSGAVEYHITIRAGATDDEIFLDNVGGIGINNVRARIEKLTAGPIDVFSFSAVPGQQLNDGSGNLWTDVMVSGTRDEFTNCLGVFVNVGRTISCGGNSRYVWFTADANSCF